MSAARVYVSLGSNVERERHVPAAVALLRERYARLERSSVYESEPVGFAGDRFFNLVVGFDTDEPPLVVQRALQRIEAACGRVRGAHRFGPRTLDADLLLHGERVLRSAGLVLPREEVLTQAFVLRPLAEIAGARRHPLAGRSYAELWASFAGPREGVWPVEFDPEAAAGEAPARAQGRR